MSRRLLNKVHDVYRFGHSHFELHLHTTCELLCVLAQLRRLYFRRQAVAVTDLRPYHQNTCVTHKRE
jgi:hypothetical protein